MVNLNKDNPLQLPSVAIVILNWNNWKDTLECLESLRQLNYSNYQIILVDNGSSDGSLSKIKDWCNRRIRVNSNFVEFSLKLKPLEYIEYDEKKPETGEAFGKLIIIDAKENLGFVGGNNLAIKYALKKRYDYIWLLNNDAVADSYALIEMIKLAEKDKRIGMVCSSLFHYDKPKNMQTEGSYTFFIRLDRMFRLKKIIKSFPFGSYPVPKWACAASLLIRNECISEIGLFNEEYFFSVEDIELCFRARSKKWSLLNCSSSKIWHRGILKEDPKTYLSLFGKKIRYASFERFRVQGYYEMRNTLNFYKNNYPLNFVLELIFNLGLVIKIIFLYDRKAQRIRVLFQAVKDAVMNKMGKSTY